MARRVQDTGDDSWSWTDDMLMFSAHVIALARAGRLWELSTPVCTSFPPRIAHDERFVAASWFTLSDWSAPGDGTYTHDGGFFFATGGVGLALSGVVAGARAAGNAARRSAAAAAAMPRWREVDRGDLFLSTHGFYLGSRYGLRDWSWPSVISADLVAHDALLMRGNGTSGQVEWILTTPWAPLVFALWCHHIHPAHPQYATNAWLPRGWWERAVALGRRPAVGWAG